MRTVYCWRCDDEVPMLTETEYAPIMRLYGECLEKAKAARRQAGKAVSDPAVQECFQPVTALYETVTGRPRVDPQEVMHHRLMLVAPPCMECGKPLRTRRARACAACGARVTPHAEKERL